VRRRPTAFLSPPLTRLHYACSWGFVLPFISGGVKDYGNPWSPTWTPYQARHLVMAVLHILEIVFVRHKNDTALHDLTLSLMLPIGFFVQEGLVAWLTGHTVYDDGLPGLTKLPVDHYALFWVRVFGVFIGLMC
jgi:hypothetical protein